MGSVRFVYGKMDRSNEGYGKCGILNRKGDGSNYLYEKCMFSQWEFV